MAPKEIKNEKYLNKLSKELCYKLYIKDLPE
jgi:hypothetical protein